MHMALSLSLTQTVPSMTSSLSLTLSTINIGPESAIVHMLKHVDLILHHSHDQDVRHLSLTLTIKLCTSPLWAWLKRAVL